MSMMSQCYDVFWRSAEKQTASCFVAGRRLRFGSKRNIFGFRPYDKAAGLGKATIKSKNN